VNAPIIPDPKKIVGLIGGIGAGKSTVAQRFAERGAVIVDADRTGHEVLKEPGVARKLADLFGTEILSPDGQIDRTKLGAKVFASHENRKKLESVVHPRMAEHFREKISLALADPEVPLIILDAAILQEVGWDAICDEVIFVDAPREIRLERLEKNRGWSPDELARREAAQWPIEQKRAKATVVIDNAGEPSQARQAVDRLFEKWKACEPLSKVIFEPEQRG
jgi:dephospho-CoA kinase